MRIFKQFYIKNMPNPNGGLRTAIFALCILSAFTQSAIGGVLTCVGRSGSDTINCTGRGPATYEDTNDISVTCPCSDVYQDFAGNIQYLCQDGEWKETRQQCQCTTCNRVETSRTDTPIYGGKKTRITTSAQCASGCSCGDSCSGTSTAFVCTCGTGYTVVNQDTESCSCEENTGVGVCYVEYCNDGYYSTGTKCIKCPNPNDKTIISGSIKTGGQNTGDVNSCYITKDTTARDSKGTIVFEADCNY